MQELPQGKKRNIIKAQYNEGRTKRMINMDDLKSLYDYYPEFDINPDDSIITINGNEYPYEMTLSLDYDDAHCCRVMIDGVYYYFG